MKLKSPVNLIPRPLSLETKYLSKIEIAVIIEIHDIEQLREWA
jgi:hypothetical protein